MTILETWEKRLGPYFLVGVRFIGEIPLSYEDIEDMAKGVRDFIERQGLARATSYLTTSYPLTFVTLMSGFAAYNTQQNFWQAFADAIQVEKNHLFNHFWHHNYVRLAKNLGLKVFDFGDDPNPYVTSIRFQGGIPSYSLPDYFARMVLPAVDRPELRELSPSQALQHLQNHVYFVDSPVLDFFEFSGDLGIEFFTNSCTLLRHARENNGEILTPDEAALPEYVVKAFEDFQDQGPGQSWRRPYLQAAPYSEDTAVNLNFPQQEISLDLSASRLFWQIYYPTRNQTEERACRMSRSRHNVVILEDYLPILEPVERVEVSLKAVLAADGTITELRRWNLSLIPPQGRAPVVVFNDQGAQVTSTRQLPADVVFLLTPLDCELVFDGEGRLLEECAPLDGAWQDWKINRWDLAQSWSVSINRAGQPVGNLIPVKGAIAQPDLVDGHLFQFQDLPEPLYSSGPPSVRVPLASGTSLDTRLYPWHVRIHSLWEASPDIDRTVRLSEYIDRVEIRGDRAFFPLSHLLGGSPAGIYEVYVSGPRGLKAEFRIRLWPKLILLGHSMQLLPPDGMMRPIEFSIRLQGGAACQPQAGAEAVQIQQTAEGCRISAPVGLNRVLLDLTAPSGHDGVVRVPVSIPLPRLRWGLATERAGDSLEWGQGLIHRSIDQLLQSGSASVHLEMYSLGDLRSDLKIQLVELGEQETILQECALSRTDFTRDWLRFTLGQFNDTIRTVNSLARFELVYSPRGQEPIRIPLLEISRALEICWADLQPLDETTWKITWQEDLPLRNRRVMLRPAWQPWQRAWEFKIPNRARGGARSPRNIIAARPLPSLFLYPP